MPPVLKKIPLVTEFTMRAPHEHMERVLNKYEYDFEFLGGDKYLEIAQKIETAADQSEQRAKMAHNILYKLMNQIVAMHGLGHPIETIESRLQDLSLIHI